MNEIKRPTADFAFAAENNMMAVKGHPEGESTIKRLENERMQAQIDYRLETDKNKPIWIQEKALEIWNGGNKNLSHDLRPPLSNTPNTPSWTDCKEKAKIIIEADISAKKAQIDNECRSKQLEVVREVQEKRVQLHQEMGVIKQNTQEHRLQAVRLFETHKTEWIQEARYQGSASPEKDAYTRYVSMQKEVTQTQQHRTEAAHQQLGFTYAPPEALTQQFSQSQSHSM